MRTFFVIIFRTRSYKSRVSWFMEGVRAVELEAANLECPLAERQMAFPGIGDSSCASSARSHPQCTNYQKCVHLGIYVATPADEPTRHDAIALPGDLAANTGDALVAKAI